jgi:hypothetical protein
MAPLAETSGLMVEAAMTYGDDRCAVCGSTVGSDATTCATCGADRGASFPTGSRAPQEPTNLLRLSAADDGPAGPSFARPESPPPPLPTRVPGRVGGDTPWETFAQSWQEPGSPNGGGGGRSTFSEVSLAALVQADAANGTEEEPTAPRVARIDQFIRAAASARTEAAPVESAAADTGPAESDPADSGPADSSPVEPPVIEPAGRSTLTPEPASFTSEPAGRSTLTPEPAGLTSEPDLAPVGPTPLAELYGLTPEEVPPVEVVPVSAEAVAIVTAPPAPIAVPSPNGFDVAPAGGYVFSSESSGGRASPSEGYSSEPAGGYAYRAGTAEPVEPPQPVQPPEPVEPPEPVRPPEPVEPPEPVQPPPPGPHEPPVRPAPTPFPTPPPPPQPVRPPQPVPPVPPTPGPPVPPTPPVPAPPPPSPYPPPPGPVPPPPTIYGAPPVMSPPVVAVPPPSAPPVSAAASPATPGLYRGGMYGSLDTQTVSVPAPAAIPRQRSGGTVYGGRSGLPTSANAEAPIEQSGSLTGLILSRGRPGSIQPKEQRSRLRKVLWVGLSAIAFVTAIALIVALLAGDFLRALFGALLGG